MLDNFKFYSLISWFLKSAEGVPFTTMTDIMTPSEQAMTAGRRSHCTLVAWQFSHRNSSSSKSWNLLLVIYIYYLIAFGLLDIVCHFWFLIKLLKIFNSKKIQVWIFQHKIWYVVFVDENCIILLSHLSSQFHILGNHDITEKN